MSIDKFISTSKNLAPSGWKHPQHILDAVAKAEPGRTNKVRKAEKSSSGSKPTQKNQERQSRHLYTSDMTATRLLELRELGYTTAQALFIIRNCGTGSGGFSEGNDCAKGKAGKDGDGDGEFEGGEGVKSSSKGSKSKVDLPDVDRDDPKAVDKAIKGLAKERKRLRDSLGELDQASLKLNEDPRREADKDSSEFKAWQAEDEELKNAIKAGDERWRAIQDRMTALQPYTSEQVARTKADQAAAEAAKKARSRKRRAQRVLAKADEEAGNAAREAAEKERKGKRSFADRLMELRNSGVPVTVAIRMARGQND